MTKGVKTISEADQRTGGLPAPRLKPQASSLKPSPAFTLVELMVVIAIIIILVGIGLTVGNSIVRSNEINRTKATLANALQVATEYDATFDLDPQRIVNHLAAENAPFNWAAPGGQAYNSPAGLNSALPVNVDSLAGNGPNGTDLPPDPDASDPNRKKGDIAVHSIERFVWATLRMNSLTKLYGNFRPEVLRDVDPVVADKGYMDLVDAWGRKLIYVRYVRDEPGVGYNADDFLPMSQVYYFASAGPDGEWGDVRYLLQRLKGDTLTAGEAKLADEAMDNIYSDETLEVK